MRFPVFQARWAEILSTMLLTDEKLQCVIYPLSFLHSLTNRLQMTVSQETLTKAWSRNLYKNPLITRTAHYLQGTGMSKRAVLLFVLVLTVSSCLILPVYVDAASRTIVVPDDFPTITAALTNAVEGDTVFVKKGNYLENQLTVNKSITLLGEDSNHTIIENMNTRPWDPTLVPFAPPEPTAINVTADNVRISGFNVTARYGSRAPKKVFFFNIQKTWNNFILKGGMTA